MLFVAVAGISFDDNAIRYVLPVLWTRSCLPIIGQAKGTPIGRILKVTHQWAAPGQSQRLFCSYWNEKLIESSSRNLWISHAAMD